MTAILDTIDLLKGFYETYKKGGQGKDPLFDKKCNVLKFEIVAKFCHYAELVGAIVYPSYAAVDTSEIGQGQVFFVPPGYFHYLENPDNVNGGNVLSFFGNENPEFIGLVGGLSAYSNEVLGSVFTKDPKFFSNLRRLEKNVFIASGTE